MKPISYIKIFLAISIVSLSQLLYATKLVEVKVVDKDHIMLYFLDGEISYPENLTQLGTRAYTNNTSADDNALVTYGTALNTTNAATVANWTIKSSDDANFGTAGKNPTNIYRKSKLSGVSQEAWNTATNDYNYDWAYEHTIFLKLPFSMVQGKTYTVQLNANINSDVNTKTFTYDIFSSKSEAIKVNIAGYLSSPSIKAADVYMWMGDGGARDYTSFQGNKVYIYNVQSGVSTEVGTLSYWKAAAAEFSDGHQMIRSAVWKADFTGFNTPGTYRLAVAGIGCSEEFTISADAYLNPFKVSTLGFFYMRIGESANGTSPVPRRPLWIPNTSPTNCEVIITTMHPYHPNWNTFCNGDKWDCKDEWATYATTRKNPNAYGGHSDALDWDRHLGHVPIIYDMLLPYFISNGALSEDNLGIPESGNGIPDILDEARNEVDFWLRLRDGKGYSHGLNNPNGTNKLYQAGNTAVAAWANAANAAMLANCFLIAGKTALANQYRDSAINAYNYASGLSDQMLTNTVDKFTGKDFKATAAAFLYNITGNTAYETMLNSLSSCTSTTSVIHNSNQNQLYAVAGYLFTKQPRNYPTLYNNMKASIINEAKTVEANYSTTRPSRRASDNNQGWFVTEMVIQRTIIAHAIADPGADKTLFENALILEADWSLGRNPLNMIIMTTATTPLASKKSVPNAYTSGWADGTPGVHPGHTPYMNIYDWSPGGMAMGNPSWMTSKNYPTTNWPYGEMYYNVRYFYAANEFTPQQTMRGKQALYGYLHAISPAVQIGCATPNITGVNSICGVTSAVLQSGLTAGGKTFTWYKDGNVISGQTSPSLTITQAGTYRVSVDSNGCVKTSDKIVSGTLQLELGENKNLCTQTEFVLDAQNASVPNVSYVWNTGATTQTITVAKAGTYSVSVSALNCPTVQDNITITSSLLNVTGDTICSPGQVTLTVTGTSTYAWYNVATGGTALSTAKTYSPTISTNTTYYVQETGGFSGSLGKATQGTGDKWSMGSGFTDSDKINKITVLQSLTLESIAVYVVSAGTNVTINIKQNGTVIHTKTIIGLATGKQTLPLNFFLAPGNYTIDCDGTSGAIYFEASGASFPYTYTGYISFTYNESWQSAWYGFFYDWKILVGSACARTPVKAVIDPTNSKCVSTYTQSISLQSGWNLFSYSVRTADSTITTLFAGKDVQEIKNADGFWFKNNTAELQSLTKLTPGKGYLVKMNTAATVQITGTPIVSPSYALLPAGWNLIGYPSAGTTPFTVLPISNFLNATNSQIVKNFDGFWEPNGTTNSITNFEAGKGYYLKK